MRYHAYAHELTEADHAELLNAAAALQGMVVVSGYSAPLYEGTLKGWLRVERLAHADSAAPRSEVLWISLDAAHQLRGLLRIDTNVS